MNLSTRGGGFVLETYTDGSPHWITIKHKGEEVMNAMHHRELSDLEYAVKRMRERLRAETNSKDI